jgi:putative endonuclease
LEPVLDWSVLDGSWLQPKADPPRAESGRKFTMYYVYVLKSEKNSKLYKGFTSDLKRRIKEHNSGNSKFTSNNGPWKLIYYEAFVDEKDARREELFLKSGKGRERIKYLFEK